MAKRRKFTPEFKAELVLEVLSGAASQAEVCRRRPNLNENQLSQWKRRVARLMKNSNLLVIVKRACQTTRVIQLSRSVLVGENQRYECLLVFSGFVTPI